LFGIGDIRLSFSSHHLVVFFKATPFELLVSTFAYVVDGDLRTMTLLKIRITFASILLLLSFDITPGQEPSTWQLSESTIMRAIRNKQLPVFSPDLNHAAHITTVGKKSAVVIDGIKQMEFDAISGLTFSPDSTRTVYYATNGNEGYLVVNGKVEPFPSAYGPPKTIAFTPDSKRIFYESKLGWVIDGKLSNYVRGPVFSKDGSRFAFCGASRVNVDGEEREIDGVVVGTQIVFSPDSKHVVFLTIRGDGVFLDLDGRESPVQGGVQALAFPHRTSKMFRDWDVLDWERPVLVFSPDSKRLAYWGYVEKDKLVMVIDGKAGTAYRGVGEAVFSQDSQHVAHAAWNYSYFHGGKSLVVVDGVEQVFPRKDQLGSRFRLVLSPDGKRLAYLVDGSEFFLGYRVVVDGVASEQYKFMSVPVFSPSGLHMAYIAENSKKWQLFVDGVATGLPSEAMYGVENGVKVLFDSDDQFHHLVLRIIDKNTLEIRKVIGHRK
jgi:WD40-like Beta Propeller Repeat